MKKEHHKELIVAVSGYFDPLHVGHLEYFQLAKQLGDKLYVIVNNDVQAVLKKQTFFMNENDRLEIIKSLSIVDNAILSIDQDKSVSKTLEKIRQKGKKEEGNVYFDVTDGIAKELVLDEATGQYRWRDYLKAQETITDTTTVEDTGDKDTPAPKSINSAPNETTPSGIFSKPDARPAAVAVYQDLSLSCSAVLRGKNVSAIYTPTDQK